jgi:long-subunit acyl-CoA synthetase (AMP-forming)
VARTYPHGIADPVVLRGMRRRVGLDRARFVLSGGAPLAGAVLEFFRDLGVPLYEVWGMSETAGVAIANPPGRVRPGTVGVPVPGVDARLAEDGELLVRGPLVADGYRADPVRTAEAFGPDGWLHTGDVAAYDDHGYLRIAGRKKELIAGPAGKNLSPSAIEGTLRAACPLLGNVIVVGDRRPFTVALVVLDPGVSAGLDEDEIDRLLEDGMAAGNDELSRPEQIRRYAVLDGPWEPGGDELTPTLQLRRAAIEAKYAKTIEALYAED